MDTIIRFLVVAITITAMLFTPMAVETAIKVGPETPPSKMRSKLEPVTITINVNVNMNMTTHKFISSSSSD